MCVITRSGSKCYDCLLTCLVAGAKCREFVTGKIPVSSCSLKPAHYCDMSDFSQVNSILVPGHPLLLLSGALPSVWDLGGDTLQHPCSLTALRGFCDLLTGNCILRPTVACWPIRRGFSLRPPCTFCPCSLALPPWFHFPHNLVSF